MTLWPFQNVVCFTTPYVRHFVAPRCSAAYCLYCVCLAALVVLPLALAFASDNVWVKESSYREQPVVTFQHDLLVVLAGSSPADAVGWGTRAELDFLLPPQVRVPIVRSLPLDENHDGVPDRWKLTVQMPMEDVGSGYQYVHLLAVYNMELRDKVREKIGGLVVLDISAPYPASGVWVHGRAMLRQTLPLRVASEARDVYSQNPLDLNWASNWATLNQPVTLHKLLERYATRNETMFLEMSTPPVWQYGPSELFEVQLLLDVPPQLVHYVPPASEILKFAWMQVFSFLVPTWLALHALKALAFDSQFVETYVVSRLPSKD